MREEPALTRDRILSYSLTAPVINNVWAGPAVVGAATATVAGAAAATGEERQQVQGRSGSRYRAAAAIDATGVAAAAAQKIGGQGHIVEIDESKFGKRKYNSGRRVVGKWILGGWCRTTEECFLVECTNNKHDHHTLLRLIKQHVNPGTDKWRGYLSF